MNVEEPITNKENNFLGDINYKKEDSNHYGLWFNVHNDSVQLILEIVDKLWLLMALLGPMVQSLYLTLKGLDTHGIIITIRDNRKANSKPLMQVLQN